MSIVSNTLTYEEQLATRDALCTKIAEGRTDTTMRKEAEADLTTFFTTRFTEDSWSARVLPEVAITSFDKHPRTSKPCKRIELEDNVVSVYETAFNSSSPHRTFGARAVYLGLDRIESDIMTKDVDDIATWSVSLRDILCDLLYNQVLYKIDARYLAAVHASIGVVAGTVVAQTGSTQYYIVPSGLDTDSYSEALDIIPSNGIDENGLFTQTVLMNHTTFSKFRKVQNWSHGPELTTGILRNGLQEWQDPFGVKTVRTIKKRLVNDGTMYFFADPAKIGVNYVYYPPTLSLEYGRHTVSFGIYTSRMGAILSALGIARCDFAGIGRSNNQYLNP